MKINLGCGHDLRPGWINVDIADNVGAEIVCDITAGLPFKDKIAEAVAAYDVLEHLTIEQQQCVLADIWRVLRPRGRLLVRIPNIDALLSQFTRDPDTRNLFLYGDTAVSGVSGAHKSGHTLKSFVTLARIAGFRLIKSEQIETNYMFEFSKTTPVTPPAHIGFINQTLGIGGAETFNAGLLEWWKNQGTDVEAWVTNPQLKVTLSERATQVHSLPMVLDVIGNWKGLIKSLVLAPVGIVMYALVTWKCRGKDILLMTGFIEKILVTPWAWLWHIPVVWVEFGPLAQVFAKFGGLPKHLYRLVSHLPDIVVMPSVHTRTTNVPLGHIPAAKVRLIPCGVSVQKRRTATVPNLVVCVSRLEAGKGQDTLLKAWPQVLKQVPNAKLRIVGEGDQYQNLKFQISNLKLTNSVEMAGWVEDALAEMAQATVCVFPSTWPLEGFGLVMVEAMALGKPVVAFAAGPTSEILDPSCGVLVPAGNIYALGRALVGQLHKPALGGRQKYLRYYTLDKVGKQYAEVFKFVMAAHQSLKNHN